jgi:hypothetical protein
VGLIIVTSEVISQKEKPRIIHGSIITFIEEHLASFISEIFMSE